MTLPVTLPVNVSAVIVSAVMLPLTSRLVDTDNSSVSNSPTTVALLPTFSLPAMPMPPAVTIEPVMGDVESVTLSIVRLPVALTVPATSKVASGLVLLMPTLSVPVTVITSFDSPEIVVVLKMIGEF